MPKKVPAGASSAAAGSGLAGQWAGEKPWDGVIRPRTSRTPDYCPDCETERLWEPGRTRLYCPECKTVDLPDSVRQVHVRAKAVAKSVAVADRAGERQARVQLEHAKMGADETLTKLARQLDTAGLTDGEAIRLGDHYRRGFLAYLPEIKHAESMAELQEVGREIAALREEAERHSVAQRIQSDREHVEDQKRWREQAQLQQQQQQRAALEAAQHADEDDDYEDDEDEPARPGTTIVVRQRQKYAAPPTTAAGAAGELAAMVYRRQMTVDRKGKCQFDHIVKPVAKYDAYGTRYQQSIPEFGPIKCCEKHLEAARTFIAAKGWPMYFTADAGEALPQYQQPDPGWAW